jgi:hypothetical protein
LTSATRVFPTAETVTAVTWKPLVLSAYCVILAVIAYHHEPWFDEAQAWLLAREASVPDLFLRQLRHEGTPGLWYLLLMLPAKLGFPYWTMHLLAAASATAASAMILWLSPFPPAIRIAIPFTYFLLYQYAVVARSYALLAPLLFAIAWFLPRTRSKPWILIALLIALANVSIHGTLAAVGILLAYLIDIRTNPGPSGPPISRQLLISCGVFLLLLAAVALEVWPASGNAFAQGVVHNITRTSHFSEHLDQGLYQITEAFAFKLRIALVPLVLSLFWMTRNRIALYFALPAGLVLAFSSVAYASPWHSGILFLLWVFAMWIASNRNPCNPPLYVWLAWAIVVGTHINWAARASLLDIDGPYSGSKALAENIAPDVAFGKRIVGEGYFLIAVQPYFQKNILMNYHGGRGPAFWSPTSSDELADSPASLASQHPDVIVVSLRHMRPVNHDQLIRTLSDSGYTDIQEFPGETIWKSGSLGSDSFLAARKKVDQ